MITTSESLKIAKIKFKTRKARNILSGCSVSLGILTILIFLFATSGMISIGQKVFVDSNANRYFASEGENGPVIMRPDMPSSLEQKTTPFDLNSYKSKNSKYNIKNFYLSKTSNASEFSLDTGTQNTTLDGLQSLMIETKDETLVPDFLYQENTFKDVYNGKIPVILPKSYVTSIEYGNIYTLSNKEQYEKSKAATAKYLNKTFKLVQISYDFSETGKYTNPKPAIRTLPIEVIIVGYSTEGNFFSPGMGFGGSILMPIWAEKNKEVAKILENGSSTVIAEFDSKKERDLFVEDKEYNAYPLVGRYEAFTEVIEALRNVGYGIGGFFLFISALFILTTVGKIVADSKKEIGVFRAIGAQKSDIKKIFFAYAFLITTLGFVMGVVLAVLFNIVISLMFGEDIFYSVVLFGSTTDIEKPFFLFMGAPIIELILLYVISIVVGFIASYIPATRAGRIDPIKALREE